MATPQITGREKLIPLGEASPVVYDLAQRDIDRQLATADALDSKATALAAASVGLLALFAGVSALHPGALRGWPHALFVVDAILTVLAALLGVLSNTLGKWLHGPASRQAWLFRMHHVTETQLTWKVTSELIASKDANADKLARKVVLTSGALILTVVSTVVTATGLYLLAR
jgi:hypothetical protein